jgi:glycosyltransferase involved in cell wall biosynthesis
VVSLYSAGFAAGTSAKDYLGILGLPAERIVTGSFVVDNEHFRRGAEAARKDAGNIRLRHGLPPRYFFLAARFLPFKNIPHALQAFARYRELARGGTPESLWSLVIAGDGPDKSEIMRLIAELNLGASVHHVGYKFYDELPTFYALAGAFVLPSLIEPWGLVVNEAMASGLPVLVSRRCGCAADLVRDGVNGYLLNPLEIEEMAQCFLRIADPKTDLATMGQASREIIQARDLETYAAGAMRAVDLAIRAPRRKATLVDTFILRNLPRKKSVVC